MTADYVAKARQLFPYSRTLFRASFPVAYRTSRGQMSILTAIMTDARMFAERNWLLPMK